MTPQIKKYSRRSRSYHDFFLCHELENYRISFYHTEGHGVSRNNLCHEFANLRIISYNHTENRGIIFVTNLRICELFLIITRRIAEGHGKQKFDNYLPAVSGSKDKSRDKKIKFENSKIRKFGTRKKPVTVRDIPCEDKIR